MCHILEIISKDINGESSDEEKIRLKRWIDESEENKNIYLSFLYFFNEENEASESEKTEVWNKVFSEIDHQANDDSKKNAPYNKVWNSTWIKFAASVTIFIFLGTFAYFLLGDIYFGEKSELSVTNKNIEWQIMSVPAGKKMSFTLPDGSTIKLNGASSLRFKKYFQSSDLREVYLEGEAFFSVAKNPKKPFIVHTSYSDIKVLGTSFNVNAFAENKEIEVAVETGKVLVNKKSDMGISDSLTLVRGEVAYLKPHAPSIEKGNFNPDSPSWKNGVLVFENASFNEITMSLKRWYGVEFKVNKEVNERGGYNARFKNQNLVNVLESMKYSLKFEYKLVDSKVIIN
jgi:hypothetical protein